MIYIYSGRIKKDYSGNTVYISVLSSIISKASIYLLETGHNESLTYFKNESFFKPWSTTESTCIDSRSVSLLGRQHASGQQQLIYIIS